MDYIITAAIIYIVWNLVAFVLMGIDKSKAKHKKRRISERTLLTVSFLFGGIGTGLGALVFNHKTRKRKFRIGIPASIVANALLIVLLISTTVVLSVNGQIAGIDKGAGLRDDQLEELRKLDAQCVMVLGCGVYSDGTPTPMLRDRLDTGIRLYNEGLAPVILLTGDDGQVEYNEIACMLNYCLEAGVPDEDIFCDHAGFSTYDSMYRARSIFEVERMIVVTQKYHLFRALFIGNEKGMELEGVASDPQLYMGALYREGREVLARNKDMVKTALDMPPKYGGETIPITGDALLTRG